LKGASPEASKLQINGLIETILPFREETALHAGTLISATKEFGLSLGDRACIATAMLNNLEIITVEKIWDKLFLPLKIHQVR
jgi:PIN domain nuclease of toxin-antitoxin system